MKKAVFVAGILLFSISSVHAGYRIKENIDPNMLIDVKIHKGEEKIAIGWKTVWYLKGKIKSNIQLVDKNNKPFRVQFKSTGEKDSRIASKGGQVSSFLWENLSESQQDEISIFNELLL